MASEKREISPDLIGMIMVVTTTYMLVLIAYNTYHIATALEHTELMQEDARGK